MLNILFVLVIVLAGLSHGCVTKRAAEEMANTEANIARKETMQSISDRDDALLASYRERLKKFHQMNDDGTLKPEGKKR